MSRESCRCVEWFQEIRQSSQESSCRRENGDEEELAGEDLTRYRSVVATANFISQDRPDVRFAVKELLSRDGQANVRQLAKVEEARQVLERSAQGRAEDQARCGGSW